MALDRGRLRAVDLGLLRRVGSRGLLGGLPLFAEPLVPAILQEGDESLRFDLFRTVDRSGMLPGRRLQAVGAPSSWPPP